MMVLGALLVLASIAFGIYFLYSNKENSFNMNTTDLCPSVGSRATVAILLDTTEEISSVTKMDIQKMIMDSVQDKIVAEISKKTGL